MVLLFFRDRMQPTVIFKHRVPGLSERRLGHFVAEVCRAIRLEGAVTVLITGNQEMRLLNARFRKKSKATDVLSFPGPPFIQGFAGDIAVSIDIAGKNARDLGHTLSNEIRILVLHGLLHLAGYDHEVDRGEMTKLEGRLRRRLGLPTALIERSVGKTGVPAVRIRT